MIHPEAFVQNLWYLGRGMLAIFLVMGVIILATYLMNRALRQKGSDSKAG